MGNGLLSFRWMCLQVGRALGKKWSALMVLGEISISFISFFSPLYKDIECM